MSKKRKRFDQVATAVNEPAKKTRYKDPIQQQVGEKLEEVGKKFEGKGRTIMYIVGAVVALVIVVGLFYSWNRRSSGAAQTALGKAIEISQARVTDAPAPAGSTEKTYKTEKERAEAAIAEFQKVADNYGGSVADKAKYFIAVNRLIADRPTGIQELESISAGSSDSAKLAKFALAQTRAEDAKLDDAVNLYQELISMDDPVIAKETLKFELAKVYEKQDKKKEAVDLYIEIAKNAAEAKDIDGKPIPMTETARDAKDKVSELAPDRTSEIPEPVSDSPFGAPGDN